MLKDKKETCLRENNLMGEEKSYKTYLAQVNLDFALSASILDSLGASKN